MSSENEILIEVNNVSKKFSKNLKKSLFRGLRDVIKVLFGIKSYKKELSKDEFWAVRNVSFQLKRGECVGLIGHNGAGKSTLLKMLNGLIKPDEGEIIMRGKIGALIELGAGFNPILSGRENIYINGQILGISKQEIDSKLDEIISFAEIAEFIDTPVQNYSSGMKVRLGFSIAAQMNPDILIIDEVLAVGDLGFVLKCFKRIDEILPRTAVIFVSHNMPQVSRICDEIILMSNGVVKYSGSEVAKGIDLYYSRFAQQDGVVIYSDQSVSLKNVYINGINSINGKEIPLIKWGDNLEIELTFENKLLSEIPFITLTVFDKEQRSVATFHLDQIDAKAESFIKIKISHSNIQLSKGVYSLTLSVSKKKGFEPVLRMNGIGSFQILHDLVTWPPFLLESKIELIHNDNVGQ